MVDEYVLMMVCGVVLAIAAICCVGAAHAFRNGYITVDRLWAMIVFTTIIFILPTLLLGYFYFQYRSTDEEMPVHARKVPAVGKDYHPQR